MLGTPIPWFAGSKGKGLSGASLCSPNPTPCSPSPRSPFRGRFLGQVASPLGLNILTYGMMDPSPHLVW